MQLARTSSTGEFRISRSSVAHWTARTQGELQTLIIFTFHSPHCNSSATFNRKLNPTGLFVFFLFTPTLSDVKRTLIVTCLFCIEVVDPFHHETGHIKRRCIRFKRYETWKAIWRCKTAGRDSVRSAEGRGVQPAATSVSYICDVKRIHSHSGCSLYHLLRFLYLRPAKQRTVTVVRGWTSVAEELCGFS